MTNEQPACEVSVDYFASYFALRAKIETLHFDSVRIAGLTSAICCLENSGECDEGRAALVFLAQDLTQKLARDLDDLGFLEVKKTGVIS